ncbi:entry exclusion lipoprotein TrbK [Pseudomonas parafulva]|uniref:entry exclusion lipoprotein TrbK n=1 Tax=Pseudomonas parafulva TaxID=157782 RepID=UPI000534E69F|nr:entry exclusion lipoprotein TrbK [Pseudomonas parafulva]
MSLKKCLIIATALTAVVGISGCKDETLDKAAYEVSDEHCKPDYLKSLPENEAREPLLEKCMTRGSYKKSEPKTW